MIEAHLSPHLFRFVSGLFAGIFAMPFLGAAGSVLRRTAVFGS